ncbi:MAG: aldo/keto reductase [Blastocatellia bacterium]|nr:aldo/keto reductase [Blastocatellia bacterium]
MTKVAPSHFRKAQSLMVSSIGLGTYLGNHDDATDLSYKNAVIRALELGCNFIDAAINYRCQRSERAIGAALKELFSESKLQRQEVVVATKGGFIPFDGQPPINPSKYFQERFIKSGLISPSDVVAGCHCMTPSYLQDQIDSSLENLGLGTIDIYYLHNPETQLSEVSRSQFNSRIEAAFELLERNVADGKINYYGTATWNGYRVDPGHSDYLSLSDLVSIAREVAGEDHHFRFLQLPYNLAMPEAFVFENQLVDEDMVSTLEAATHYGVNVVCSASIFQAKLSKNLPEDLRNDIKGLKTDAQRAIQFTRSTPGVASGLVGMSRQIHVEENMQVATISPMQTEEFLGLFTSKN